MTYMSLIDPSLPSWNTIIYAASFAYAPFTFCGTSRNRSIRDGSGKPASDWVDDKIQCKFTFPGMCWALSFIPLNIWKVGKSNSNIIGSLHSNANLKGTSCSLLGGMKKGQYLDTLKQKDMKAFEDAGIRPSFKNGTWVESISYGLKRKATAYHNTLAAQDTNIAAHNKCLKTAHETTLQAHSRLEGARTEGQVVQASQALARAETSYHKKVLDSLYLASKRWGSGRVGIMLPTTHSL
ncbi:hypothetical protein BDN71DRAFT_1431559 [Pleurotus eryngii]|uniref:Uncharacterized protein n=1 Tax=Pleurotus eryngii TaxID=5323 RepID=A0A9P5ZVG4_PLEER|nr:hypothetical protein BDN71DRAFT_1431559 [Pleurotus eryngii]